MCHRHTAMSLSSRMERVMDRTPAESIEEFRQLDLETMSQHRITFGRTHVGNHVGKTYAEMWDQEKQWTKWFAKTHADSRKTEHMKLLAYMEEALDQYEKAHNMVPLKNPEDLQGVILPKSKCMPKSRAMPADQIPVEVAEDEIDPLDPWDVMDASSTSHVASTEMIDALQVRVLNMEGALAEILGHLRQGN